MSPEEAKARYLAEWPALNAEKEAAQAAGDLKAARKARQQLSFLSQECAARHAIIRTPHHPTELTVMALAAQLAEAVAKDEAPEEGGFDLSAGMFGRHVSAWLRQVAEDLDAGTANR